MPKRLQIELPVDSVLRTHCMTQYHYGYLLNFAAKSM